jgi:hypothetical protein
VERGSRQLRDVLKLHEGGYCVEGCVDLRHLALHERLAVAHIVEEGREVGGEGCGRAAPRWLLHHELVLRRRGGRGSLLRGPGGLRGTLLCVQGRRAELGGRGGGDGLGGGGGAQQLCRRVGSHCWCTYWFGGCGC